MTTAAPRRRAAAALAAACLLVLLALGLTSRLATAQVPCDELGLPIGCEPTSTTEETTTTVEDTSTTEDTVDDTDTTTEDTRAPSDDEEIITSSTLTVTTLNNVLIPGDGTEGAETTTTTTKSLAGGKDGLSDEHADPAHRRWPGTRRRCGVRPHLAVLDGHPADRLARPPQVGWGPMADSLDVDGMLKRFRDRAAAVRNRPLPPVAGEERTQFIEQAQRDFQDYAIVGDAVASVEDGVLVLRIDLRPPSE